MVVINHFIEEIIITNENVWADPDVPLTGYINDTPILDYPSERFDNLGDAKLLSTHLFNETMCSCSILKTRDGELYLVSVGAFDSYPSVMKVTDQSDDNIRYMVFGWGLHCNKFDSVEGGSR